MFFPNTIRTIVFKYQYFTSFSTVIQFMYMYLYLLRIQHWKSHESSHQLDFFWLLGNRSHIRTNWENYEQ